MSQPIGIERIGVWPGCASLTIDALCAARGLDAAATRADYLVDERTVLAPWEDAVTFAVNAARAALADEDLASVGLLIVGTETSVDQEKPISSWVHGLLGLPSDCINFEVKHACYGATAALRMAEAWLLAGLRPGRKALIVSADAALLCLGAPYEPVTGAGACALLLSHSPRLIAYEPGKSGVYAHEISDVIRPTGRVETGGGETSLFAYLEATSATYDAYLERVPEAHDFDAYFARNIYHVPFGGITYRAHRALLDQHSSVPRSAARAHFERRVLPSLVYNRRMGGTYGASTFIALVGLCATDPDLAAGDRVGLFAYGSGSCAEFQSALVAPDFRQAAREAKVAALLDRRRRLSVAEYELCERVRDEAVGARDYTPDRRSLGDLYASLVEGRRHLVLDRVDGHYRHYSWS
jgi:3-hydroxy-3-methylglutaryl CoA synthase